MKELLETRLADLYRAEKEMWAHLNFILGRQEEVRQVLRDMEGASAPLISGGNGDDAQTSGAVPDVPEVGAPGLPPKDAA